MMNRWIYSIERIRIRWDEELRWLVDWIFVVFVYSVHIRIYVLFFFFVYSMHLNHFFLPYCKNLCSFFAFFGLPCAHQSFFFFHIVRIYVLSLLFFLFTVCTSKFFFFYCKNLYTFFVFCLHINHFFLL